MPNENVELVRAAYEAYERGDVEALLALIDPQAVTFRAEPDARKWSGADGVLRALADWTADMDQFEMTVEDYLDASDSHVIARVHQSAVGHTSGVPIEADFWMLHGLAGGRIVRTDIFSREEQALAAIREQSENF